MCKFLLIDCLVFLFSLISKQLNTSAHVWYHLKTTLPGIVAHSCQCHVACLRSIVQVVVNALIKAIPSICNVMVVCVVFWLIFGIMGVQLFSGQFYSCKYDNGTRVSIHIVDNKTECIEQGYLWVNAQVNFDDVLQAYLALFQVVSVPAACNTL